MVWKRGQSGNPSGRAPGRGAVAELRAMLTPVLPELFQRVLLQALAGDTTAQRLILDRVVPVLKAEVLPIEVPDLDPDGPLMQQGQAILRAVAAGDIPPDIGTQLMAGVAQLAGIKQVDELEARLRALEGSHDDLA